MITTQTTHLLQQVLSFSGENKFLSNNKYRELKRNSSEWFTGTVAVRKMLPCLTASITFVCHCTVDYPNYQLLCGHSTVTVTSTHIKYSKSTNLITYCNVNGLHTVLSHEVAGPLVSRQA